MRTHQTIVQLGRDEVETLMRELTISELTLPFWGYRRPIPVHRIIRLEGEGNYTHLYFDDGTTLIVSLTLKLLESRLPPCIFVRIHKKNVINLLYVREISPNHHPYAVVLSDGACVEISRRKVTHFYKQIEVFVQRVKLLQQSKALA